MRWLLVARQIDIWLRLGGLHINHHGFGLINTTLLEIIQILRCLLFLKSLLNISSFFI